MKMRIDNKVFPSVYVSHGAPTLVIEESDAVKFLQRLGAELGRPRAILCVSAHWQTRVPVLSADAQPETIHDSGGFPEALYKMRYSASGAPEVAVRAASLLKEAGIDAQVARGRGLDHGAWVPLKLMYPEADIPVTQLSVQTQAGPAHHYSMGQALEPLRHEGVLILASGGAVHNLSGLSRDQITPDGAAQFDDWLHHKITNGSVEELIDYRRLAPHGELAHPTEDHLLPLFVAMGAGASGETHCGQALHRSWSHGSLSMAAYRVGDAG